MGMAKKYCIEDRVTQDTMSSSSAPCALAQVGAMTESVGARVCIVPHPMGRSTASQFPERVQLSSILSMVIIGDCKVPKEHGTCRVSTAGTRGSIHLRRRRRSTGRCFMVLLCFPFYHKPQRAIALQVHDAAINIWEMLMGGTFRRAVRGSDGSGGSGGSFPTSAVSELFCGSTKVHCSVQSLSCTPDCLSVIFPEIWYSSNFVDTTLLRLGVANILFVKTIILFLPS